MSATSDILDLQTVRKERTDQLQAMVAKAEEEERSLTPEEQDEFDTIDKTIGVLDGQIEQIRAEDAATQERIERAGKRAQEWETSAGRRTAPGQPMVPVAGNDGASQEPVYQSLGEQLIDVARFQGPERDPEAGQRLARARLAPSGMNEGLPSEGGALVQRDFVSQLLTRTYESSDLLGRVTRVPLGPNSSGTKVPALDETSRADGSRWGGVQMYWKAEGDTVTATKPKLRLIELDLKGIMGLCYASDELLQDAGQLEAIVNATFPAELAFKLENAIVNGTGAGQPLGVLNSGAVIPQAKETNQAASTLVYENIVKMWSRMWSRSRVNSMWIYDQTIEPQLMTMKLDVGTGGGPVYIPPGGASAAPYGTILGRPAIASEHCQALGTAGDLFLLDLSQYLFIEKGPINAASSMHVRFIYDEMTFRFTYRCDGQPTWASAVTPKSGGATQSPYISLAAR